MAGAGLLFCAYTALSFGQSVISHSREGGNLDWLYVFVVRLVLKEYTPMRQFLFYLEGRKAERHWIPAFAGMTKAERQKGIALSPACYEQRGKFL